MDVSCRHEVSALLGFVIDRVIGDEEWVPSWDLAIDGLFVVGEIDVREEIAVSDE